MEWVNWIYLITPLTANITAHIIKYVINKHTDKKTKLKSFFHSGGAVSAHSATFFSLATIIGLLDGFTSAIFAVVLCLAILVSYDSIKVRRATGEQGDAIAKLVKTSEKPFNAHGHTPTEMILGVIWGILIGVSLYMVFL